MNTIVSDLISSVYSIGLEQVSGAKLTLYRFNISQYGDIDATVLQAINVLEDIDEICIFLDSIGLDNSVFSKHYMLLEDLKDKISALLNRSVDTLAEIAIMGNFDCAIATINDYGKDSIIIHLFLKEIE